MTTHNIPFSIYIKKIYQTKLSQICSQGIFFLGLKNEFETAVVNEPSVCEPLKFYCTFFYLDKRIHRAHRTMQETHFFFFFFFWCDK